MEPWEDATRAFRRDVDKAMINALNTLVDAANEVARLRCALAVERARRAEVWRERNALAGEVEHLKAILGRG